jgi:hypothetical protein
MLLAGAGRACLPAMVNSSRPSYTICLLPKLLSFLCCPLVLHEYQLRVASASSRPYHLVSLFSKF